jgi:hypothetical protein
MTHLRTVVIAHDTQQAPFEAHAYRQCPGQWPCGNSLAGRTFFVPPAGHSLEADWLVCPTPPPAEIRTNIPRERRIFLVMEPPEYWQPSKELLGQFGWVVSPYQIPGFDGVQIPSVTTGLFWWYGIHMNGHRPTGPQMSFEAIRSEALAEKKWKVSTITSTKNFLPGHRARLEFTAMLKEALGDRLDLFGHGHNPIADKREALSNYQFHLAIENAVHPHFWTEKLSDPILGRCIVFYHGATEIEKYFSNRSVIPIDISNADRAVQTIFNRLNKVEVPTEDIEDSRLKILESYNFPFFIDRLIDSIEAQ